VAGPAVLTSSSSTLVLVSSADATSAACASAQCMARTRTALQSGAAMAQRADCQRSGLVSAPLSSTDGAAAAGSIGPPPPPPPVLLLRLLPLLPLLRAARASSAGRRLGQQGVEGVHTGRGKAGEEELSRCGGDLGGAVARLGRSAAPGRRADHWPGRTARCVVGISGKAHP
jgi:hypothetical protein